MKALIIAAGKGSRLENLSKGHPKPLINLLGLSLLERVILTARKAGIAEFIMVIGFLGERIKEKLGDGKNYGVKITYIENKEWQGGNGVSVLAAKKVLNEDFVLLMADHIFDAKILDELKEINLKNKECILAIDRTPREYIDLDDATKVKVENGRIVDIGKKIENHSGLDCGIFLLSPSIFEALEKSVKEGDQSLSGGIRVLARDRIMKYFDIKDAFWFDIDTKSSYKKAEKILFKQLIKPTDGQVSRFLNRPVSLRISKLLVMTKIKPNLISFASFLICVFSAFLLSAGNYFSLIIGGVLAQFSSIVDGCDGEVARLKFQESDYGAWFDAVLDRYADAFLLFGLTYHVYFLSGSHLSLLIGFMAILGTFMNSYTADKYDGFMKRKLGPGGHYFRMGRDVRIFIIFIGALINQPLLALVIIAILMNIENIRRVVVLSKNG
ncbi:MAG: sugar phosphate nucleotidyltransferase [Omnitrophica bacterium]|nr:sugar phosphate nucleotidyltransferase [Candidatus Omnitrophota bacterium]